MTAALTLAAVLVLALLVTFSVERLVAARHRIRFDLQAFEDEQPRRHLRVVK
jgi:hypothetical protein